MKEKRVIHSGINMIKQWWEDIIKLVKKHMKVISSSVYVTTCKTVLLELFLVVIFGIIVCFYNPMIGEIVIVCTCLSIMSFVVYDGRGKVILMLIAEGILLAIGYSFYQCNEVIENMINSIYNEYTWLVWFGCITINNFILSKICARKEFKHRVSCVVGYLFALIIGFYYSIVLCAILKYGDVVDKSQNINFICAVYILVFTIIQIVVPSLDEIELVLFWDYELDDANAEMKLKKYKGIRKRVSVKSEYKIAGQYFKTYVDYGLFIQKNVKYVSFEEGVVIRKQTIYEIFGENSYIEMVVGLTDDAL